MPSPYNRFLFYNNNYDLLFIW